MAPWLLVFERSCYIFGIAKSILTQPWIPDPCSEKLCLISFVRRLLVLAGCWNLLWLWDLDLGPLRFSMLEVPRFSGLVFELHLIDFTIFDEMLSCFSPFLARLLSSLGDQNRTELLGLMFVF